MDFLSEEGIRQQATGSELMIRSYQDLIAWQRCMELVTRVYELNQRVPN